MVNSSTNSEDNNSPSIEEIKKKKVPELKKILGDHGLPVTGKKADLVLRCHVLFERNSSANNSPALQDIQDQSEEYNREEPLSIVSSSITRARNNDTTYESLASEAVNSAWDTDLRKLPPFSFVLLYDYLVLKTAKYDHESIRTAGYKKLKAFQFFKEGHIKSMHVGVEGRKTYVKGEVLASMKQEKYKVMISFNHLGEVLKAACQCPSGRGVGGLGHCNHAGGIHFAIEDFCHQGLKNHCEAVSCTSRLCRWNVPRKMKVDPKPVDDIIITKYRFGKQADKFAKVSLYDPRAPVDRQVNRDALQTLSQKLSGCLENSSYFLFYNLYPKPYIDDDDIEIDSICEALPENAPDVVVEETIPDLPFNDDYDISSPCFKSMMKHYMDGEKITDQEIAKVERVTRGQSKNENWRELKQFKLTAFNFRAAATRHKEPDKLLKSMMYINNGKKIIPALEYGQHHEDDAVTDYIAAKAREGNTNLRVCEVGTIVSKKRPGFRASLDRMVHDPMASGMKTGGLEVKCPYSKQGMSVEEACEDNTFCICSDESAPKLKFAHQYYYQIQGQMFVCELEWVDFVVWFGKSNLFIERVFFNKEWWDQVVLPRLDFFYARAFLPEVLTRRVERGVKLYNHGGWVSFKTVSLKKKSRN